MISISIKDKTNPKRDTVYSYQTNSPKKAWIFTKALVSMLIYDQYKIEYIFDTIFEEYQAKVTF